MEKVEKVQKLDKRKIDKQQIATRVLAGMLVILMLVGSVGSFVYYLINYVVKK